MMTMTSNSRNNFSISLFNLLLILSFLVSCIGEPTYPTELVTADSLMRHGMYEKARLQLACYDSTQTSKGNCLAYRRLMELELKYANDKLSETDFSMGDSLLRYYRNQGYSEKIGRLLLMMGAIYKLGNDHPNALKHYLDAKKLIDEFGDRATQGWVCQSIGDLYFDQRMFSDCIPYYRQFYALSEVAHDTLRLALASFRMGIVNTIINNIDSTIFYYKKAIDFGESQRQTVNNQIVIDARQRLSDTYIQIEKFDDAKCYMSRDSIDDQNWAYWHLGQQHVDSAIYYFHRILDKYGWVGKTWFLRELANIELKRGNTATSVSYFQQYTSAVDSLQANSQVNETRRINAQYNYNRISKDRDEQVHRAQITEILLLTVVLIGICLGYVVFSFFIGYRKKKEEDMEQERRLRMEENNKFKKQIAQLESSLLSKGQETSQIAATLFQRIRANAGKDDFHLNEDEWLLLSNAIDTDNDQFTSRLLALNNRLSEHELHVCYLVKMGLTSVAISRMLFRTDKAIFMTRQRLYAKLTGKEGTARDFNDFIKDF